MKLLVNDIDIINDVHLLDAVYEEFATASANRLFLSFDDSDSLWQHWKFKTNDIISIVEGQCDTKELYVHSVNFSRGYCNVIAKSIPCDKFNNQSRAYSNVKLSKIAKDTAKEIGFKVDISNMTDRLYSSLIIDNTSLLAELRLLCKLEGIGIVLYGNSIILFDENKIENMDTTSELSVESDDEFSITDLEYKLCNKCIVENGDIIGSFAFDNGADNIFTYSQNVPATTVGEANRFAKGLLRFINKTIKTGYVKTELKTEYAAGSVVLLNNSKTVNYNDKIFIEKVRHDFVRNSTKMFFRYVIEGY